MRITLDHIGRRFNREWIFRGVDFTFEKGKSYAVLGHNGSGKSTLLQIIAGSLTPSEGRISYETGSARIDSSSFYQYLSIAAPYLELIEEFSLSELIDFHFSFKSYRTGLDKQSVVDLLGFEKSKSKQIRHFSSGMKQRTKLALSFCTDSEVLLLDEPTANLDSQGIDWYRNFITQFTSDRLVIICSNQEHEYSFCHSRLNVLDYK